MTSDWCGRSKDNVGSTIPREVGLGCIGKVAEHKPGTNQYEALPHVLVQAETNASLPFGHSATRKSILEHPLSSTFQSEITSIAT